MCTVGVLLWLMATDADKLNVDSIIQRLLEGLIFNHFLHIKVYSLVHNLEVIKSFPVVGAVQQFWYQQILYPPSFLVRGSRPGKNVQLSEAEIRGLCLKTREIFLSQPILLELEAPLKICGTLSVFLCVCVCLCVTIVCSPPQVISMVNTMTCFVCLSMEVFLPSPTTSSLETM